MRRTLPLLLVTVPLLSLAACTSVAPMQVRRFEARTPAPAPAESRSVLFSKLVSRMPPGRQIGTVQTGIACIGTRKMFEQSNGIDLRDPGLINAVNEELQKAGYRALGASSSLFGRTEESAWPSPASPSAAASASASTTSSPSKRSGAPSASPPRRPPSLPAT